MSQNFQISRNDDQWVTSYDVWAKLGGWPIEEGDGVFVGNYTIDPDQDYITVSTSLPSDATWYFAAVSIYRREKGIFAPLTEA